MYSMKRMVPVFTCLLLLSTSIAVRAEVVDWIVAKVNDEIILYSELQKKMSLIEKSSPDSAMTDPNAKFKMEQELLQQMIWEKLAEQEAERYKISVSDIEVNKAIEKIREDNNFTEDQMEYMLSQEGQTLDRLKENIRREIKRSRLLERVLKSKTVITEDQMNAYLKNEGPLSTADRRHLALIFLASDKEGDADALAKTEEKTRRLHDRLKKGEDFAKLAREYSQGPGAKEGGDIGYMASDELAPPIEKATRDLKPGEFTDVIKASNGCYLFKVVDVEKKAGDPTDSRVREKVRRKLFQEEVNRKYETWIRELEKRAFIQIHLKPSKSTSQLSSHKE